LENFKHFDEILGKHQNNAQYYNERFEGSQIGVTKALPEAKPAYWLYTLNVNNRDELMAKLKENGVAASKVHARNDTHTMFKASKCNLPCVDKFNKTHLCIPVGWWLSEEDRKTIADLVLKYGR
jgi:dTDP-4-amino-4,6-dideoxygalactose transaminase